MTSLAKTYRSEDFYEGTGRSEHAGQDPEMYNLQARYLQRVIARHRWLIIGIVGITLAVAILSQMLATPRYRTTATVQVELTDEEGANQAEAAARNAQRVENEAKIYRSRAVAEHVVRTLDLTSSAKFMGGAAKPPDKVREEDRAVATTKLVDSVRILNNEKSDLIDIEVTSPFPKIATRIANQYADSAQAMRLNRREERRKQLLAGLDKQAKRLAGELAAAEKRVADFRRDTGMLEGAGGSEDLSQINRVAVETASAEGMQSAMAARSAGVSRAAGMRTTAGAASPLLQQQQQEYETLLNERARLASLYGSGHPEMVRVQNQIDALKSNIDREKASALAVARAQANAEAAQQTQLARSEAAAASARAGRLQSELRGMLSKAFRNNTNNVELARLEREAQVAHDVYMATHKQAEEVRALLGVIGVNSTLVSPATVPTDPFSPTPKKTITAAFFGSLVLSLLLVFAKEIMDDKVRSVEQVRRWFGLPTYGMFPLIPGLRTSSLEDSPVLREPQSLFAEVARAVHSEVLDLGRGHQPHTVLITSPLPGDGKSTVALSLCAAAASAGRRAIIVDFDLRRPGMMQEIQRQSEGPDLVELLLDPAPQFLLPNSDQESTSREIETYKPRVLSVREPVRDPASLISHRRVVALMANLREQYDLVIVNGPAALAVRDARTLSEIADHTLMVLSWGRTTIDEVNATMQQMSGKIDAAVFDKVDYAEHARRGYGDSVQFYMDSAAYYTGDVPRQTGLAGRLRRLFKRPARVWQG
ncbi:GumC family protein [Stakelama saccharophila]|uniref:Wzz/FepE/Etk N-terminal domain-containing protein n=1 Tax=Stakelama saccharophila TaxID=3075605 RepID=A0ABZ0B9Y4_9SPHN|nr:Wzz/FepE/Etk N-terminal domain-containing protein [Stakelama sp. W311]WNO54194.1 Wzz/FepE/Etk N-terminal domain-containing protein [Stakelama sp. W311]